MLTTITPYWDRIDTLRVLLKALNGAGVLGVRHLFMCVGPPTRELIQLRDEQDPRFIEFLFVGGVPGDLSIGHYHNIGASMCNSEWIMKLDVDTIPHVSFFHHLLALLDTAGDRDWYNVGMFYALQDISELLLSLGEMPLKEEIYHRIVSGKKHTFQLPFPAGSNFVCRRESYIALGGSLPGFRGYGWEDYQQLYMLEEHRLQGNPLPGVVSLVNVTQRCRDELSRKKAAELLSKDPALALLHRWHSVSTNTRYRNTLRSQENRTILLEYILAHRARRTFLV